MIRTRIKRNKPLKVTTIRQFDGGWNVIDNDLNLTTKYAKKYDNWMRSPDGTSTVRFGTGLFSDIADLTSGDIVGMEFFLTDIIAVISTGEIVAINGQGDRVVIWSDAIAAALPGSPNGWGETSFVSFSPWKGNLIVCNGFDKPLIIDSGLTVRYLADLATGSNVNTPVARYVLQIDRYTVMAGDLNNIDRLHIANTDTSGTWVGDGAPNNAIRIDLGSRVTKGSPEITGISAYRGKLVITFDEIVLIATLGVFNSTVHEPVFSDPIENNGAIGHKTFQSLGDDLLFADAFGVPSLERALFTGAINPNRKSQLIDPEINKALDRIDLDAWRDRVFSVYNKRDSQFMLFVPNGSTDETITETVAFVYTKIDQLDVEAWTRFRGWKFTSAVATAEGLVFLARGSQIYLYGNTVIPLSADFIGDQETYSDDTVHTDGTGFYPIADVEKSGVPIHFDWQLPWADFKERMSAKHMKFVQIDASGDGEFTLEAFFDNFLTNPDEFGEPYSDGTDHTDGTGFISEEEELLPALSMDFVGNAAQGFGLSPFGSEPFGGGRPAGDERFYKFPGKFKLLKLRLHGDTMKPLSVTSISIAYQKGA